MTDFTVEVFAILNGPYYIANDSRETEVLTPENQVPIAEDTPEAGSHLFFLTDLQDLTCDENNAIAFTGAQTKAFLGDQFVFLRNICAVPVESLR
jgi:hypothetical protein